MECSLLTWPLVSVYHQKSRINPTPEYQRFAVWSRRQQKLLIDSIMQGFDIPKLYLRALDDGSPFKYEAVDGQQRLRAVWEYFDNDYALDGKTSPDLAGKFYDDLSEDERMRLEHYQFNLVVIKSAQDADIREMFCRLQNGKPLNSAEKRNAMVSGGRDFCVTLANHDLFKRVGFSNKRMEHHQVAAQTLAIEIASGPTNVQNSSLGRLYEQNKNFDVNGDVARHMLRVYDFLAKTFPEKTPELKRGYVVSLYLLGARLLRAGVGDAPRLAPLFRAFALDFDVRRRTESDNVEMIKFGERLSSAADSEESIKFRDEVLGRAFGEFEKKVQAQSPVADEQPGNAPPGT